MNSTGGRASGLISFRLNSEESAQVTVKPPHTHSTAVRADFIDRLHGWVLMNDRSLVGTSDGGKNLTILLPSSREADP